MEMLVSLTDEEDCEILENRTARTTTYVPSYNDKERDNPLLIEKVRDEGAISLTSCAIEFNCVGCNLCKAIRVKVDNFTPSQSQRKVLRKNSDLTFRVISAQEIKKLEALFVKHHFTRFPVGNFCVLFHEAKHTLQDNDLIAIATNKEGEFFAAATLKKSSDGLVGIKRFFDPDINKRSLGVYLDIKLIEYAQQESIKHFYLGAINLESSILKNQGRYKGSEVFNRATRNWVPIERNPQSLDHIP